MKLRKSTIWAVALGMTACTAVSYADKLPRHSRGHGHGHGHGHGATKPAAPVVQLPQDAQHVVVATPLGGPSVTLPVRGGVDVATTPAAAPVAMAATSTPRIAPAAAPATPAVAAPPASAPKVALPPGDVPRPRTAEAGPVIYLPQQ